jgi:hypothetical protein
MVAETECCDWFPPPNNCLFPSCCAIQHRPAQSPPLFKTLFKRRHHVQTSSHLSSHSAGKPHRAISPPRTTAHHPPLTRAPWRTAIYHSAPFLLFSKIEPTCRSDKSLRNFNQSVAPPSVHPQYLRRRRTTDQPARRNTAIDGSGTLAAAANAATSSGGSAP